jgi:hypothetical protein
MKKEKMIREFAEFFEEISGILYVCWLPVSMALVLWIDQFLLFNYHITVGTTKSLILTLFFWLLPLMVVDFMDLIKKRKPKEETFKS